MGRQRVVAFVVVAAVVAFGVSPRGQTAERQSADYAAVQAYVTGHDAAKVVAPLAGWSPRDVHNAARRYLDDARPSVAAAATLHLEIAVAVVMVSADLAGHHLESGHLLIGGLRPSSRSVPSWSAAEIAAFAEKWYTAAASVFLMVNDPMRAAPIIGRGLQVAPRSGELRLLSGILDEISALSVTATDSRGAGQQLRITNARRQAFMRAKDTLAKLVADEPRFTRARIRLGRVLWMLGEGDAALVELLRAQSETTDPVQRYLAAMFLGAIYEQHGNVTGARVAYERR